MSFGVFEIKIPGPKNFQGFFAILPELGVNGNILQGLQGTTSKGLLAVIFPNGEAMLTSWGVLSGDLTKNIVLAVAPVKMDPHLPPLPGQGKGLLGGLKL